MKTLTIDMVTVTVTPEEEFEPITRELSFQQTGADHSQYIRKVQRDNGCNPWLWCTVAVKAEFKGLTGTAYLGCCAYRNEEDFKAGGYFEQMRDEAFLELKQQVDEIAAALV
jgi:hypothetical protein